MNYLEFILILLFLQHNSIIIRYRFAAMVKNVDFSLLFQWQNDKDQLAQHAESGIDVLYTCQIAA
jgi:hypothetical protein